MRSTQHVAIKISGHVDADGILKLEIPVGFANQEVEGVLVMQQPTMFAREAHGWPIGFFQEIVAMGGDVLLERPDQDVLEVRDPIG